ANVLGRPYLNGVASDERAAIALLLEQAMQGKPSEFEFHGAGAMSGKVFSSNFVPMFDADHRVEKIMGISEDITGRKQAEVALKASEARFRQVFDHTFDGLVVIQDGVIVMANQTIAQVLGVPVPALTGQPMLEFMHPDDREMVVEKYHRRMAGEDMPPFQTRVVSDLGWVEWVEIRGNLIDFEGRPADLVVIRDVTGERLSAEKLRASEARLEHLLQASPAVIYSCAVEPPFAVSFISPNISRQMGYTSQQFFDDPDFWSAHIHPDDSKRVFDGLPQLFEHDHHTHEYRFRHADGSWLWIRDELRLICDAAGDPQEIVGYWIDINERKQQEQFDADQREILEQIADSSVPLTDVLYAIIKAAQRQRPEMKGSILLMDKDGKHLRHGAAPDLPEEYCRVFDGAPIGPSACSCGMAVYRKERVIVGDIASDPLCDEFRESALSNGLAACWSEPVMDAKGHVLGTFAMYYNEPRMPDVSDIQLIERMAALAENAISHKQAEVTIRQNAERMRMVLDADFDAVVVQQDGRVVFSNRQAQQMFGYHSLQETLGQDVFKIFLPEHRKFAAAVVRRAIRTGRSTGLMEMQGVSLASSEPFPMEIASTPIEWGGKPAVVSNARDISARKQAALAIAERENKFKELVRMVPDALIVHQDGRLVFANDAAVRLFGFESLEAVTGVEVIKYVHPDFHQKVAARLQRLYTGEVLPDVEEERFIKVDGTVFDGEVNAVLTEHNGRPAAMIVVRDISARKQAEQALQEGAARIQSVARNTTGVVFQFGILPDGNWYFPFVSESVERFIGVSAVAVMQDAQTLISRVHADDVAGFIGAITAAVASTSPLAWQGRFMAMDGVVKWFACSSEPQLLADGSTVWNGVAVDETAQHQLEAQLRQAQKMEAVGTLAGGIAHDFNNMLAGMLGQLFLVKGELTDRPDTVQRIASVEEQGHRAAEMIQQMLTFARKSHVSMREIPLAALLKDTLKLHRVGLPENIELQVCLEHEEMIIRGDAAMLQQMVLNLLNNARDAVTDVGRPCITLDVKPVLAGDDCYRRHEALAGKPLVCLSVLDNGCGMTETDQASIFDPFFTTKEVGKGTGLGLAMVFGGMQTHGGAVEVISEPGAGSEFRLYFPRLDRSIQPQVANVDEAVRGDGRCVLVADDEPVLRQVLDDVLVSLGYRVILAVDGEQAVKLFKQHRHEIDIAILDVVMPVLGGPAACKKIRAIDPLFPVMFHTGYGQGALIDEVVNQPLCDSLTKPVSIAMLTRRLAALLHLSNVKKAGEKHD
ncbi:MAG: PAS domain S-box protein, partial [Mariprofundus sp.]